MDFLKIDCEGAEYDILFDCPKSILNIIKKIAMEVHTLDKKRNMSIMADFLKKEGFDIEIKPIGDGSLINLVYAVRK